MTNFKSMEHPIISIVTVGMNHYKYIKDLYKSLYDEAKPSISFEAIYVDNCSSDGSVEYIRNNFPQVIIIQNEKIKGFGENNNLGVSYAKGKYIAIINPDIIFQKDSLDGLYNYMINQSVSAGIVVPQLLNPDHSIQYSVRSFVTLRKITFRFISRGKDSSENKHIRNYLQKDIDTLKTQAVDWAIGAAMFIEKDFFLQLKGFDLDYFLYMEDEDICFRSWKKGKPVIYLPESKMIHNHLRGSSSIGKKTILHFKSLLTFFRKHGWNVTRPIINSES